MTKLLTLFFVLLLSNIMFSQEVVLIEANQGWQNTGISINSGEMLLFFARGAWAANVDDRPLNWWGPSGRGQAEAGDPLMSAPVQALIGRIGISGTPFEIGSYMVYGSGGQDPLNESGILYMRINDHDANLGDNQGMVYVSVFKSVNIQVTSVSADADWQNTGIRISAANAVMFLVRGAWAGNIDDRPLNWWGASGRSIAGSGAPLSTAPGLSLIGKLGASGVPFEIGAYRFYGIGGQEPINQSGTLYLRINDSDASLGDNRGNMVVSVIQDEGAVSVQDDFKKHLHSFRLSQNYPNPFNPVTTIEFELFAPGQTKIIIFNQTGQEVKTLLNQNLPEGKYVVNWNGTNDHGDVMPSGAYFYQIFCGEITQAKRMILLK